MWAAKNFNTRIRRSSLVTYFPPGRGNRKYKAIFWAVRLHLLLFNGHNLIASTYTSQLSTVGEIDVFCHIKATRERAVIPKKPSHPTNSSLCTYSGCFFRFAHSSLLPRMPRWGWLEPRSPHTQQALGLPLYKFKVSRSLTPPGRPSCSSDPSKHGTSKQLSNEQTHTLNFYFYLRTKSVLIEANVVVVAVVVVLVAGLLSFTAHFDTVIGWKCGNASWGVAMGGSDGQEVSHDVLITQAQKRLVLLYFFWNWMCGLFFFKDSQFFEYFTGVYVHEYGRRITRILFPMDVFLRNKYSFHSWYFRAKQEVKEEVAGVRRWVWVNKR